MDTRLLELHVATLFTLDAEGDLIATNEPYPPARKAAPTLHLAWSDRAYICRFRHDIPAGARRATKQLLAAQWPFADRHIPPVDSLSALLAPHISRGRVGSGPAYIFPPSIEGQDQVQLIDRSQPHLLGDGFADEVVELDYIQPCCAVVDGGAAVSLCRTVRRSAQSAEAGIDTLAPYRRRGYARSAVAAWGLAIQDAGLTPFYSTSWDNLASQGLAANLGLIQFATESSLS